MDFKKSSLWRAAFCKYEHHKCAELELNFDQFRERVKTLANEIGTDQPFFTVHNITHIDSLWNMGSIITGDAFDMNPLEGFVLGCAFLVHDLAMSRAAYSSGISELKKLPQWHDIVHTPLKRQKSYDYCETDICEVGEEIQLEATRILLRELHASKARDLCNQQWTKGGNNYFLIDNLELQEEFGTVIGEIASSHWWSVEDVKQRLNDVLGASF